jgi:hydrogenase nickel incorporation protein HypB
MCDHCGCGGEGQGFTLINPDDHHHDHNHHQNDHNPDHIHPAGHHHLHEHRHFHEHEPESQEHRISIETDVLQKNNLLAQRNRGYFEAKNILALNLVSSPGSGKTTLLERTITELSGQHIYVIEGDQQTSLDAERIHATGAPVIQVNTGSGCHLDAEMINKAVKALNPADQSFLFIENVGNLVCPALFDLGEQYRVIIISITEGEDKPLKYPGMFQSSHLCLMNKTDLMPFVKFDLDELKENILKVNPELKLIELSAITGEGFEEWIEWIKKVSTQL